MRDEYDFSLHETALIPEDIARFLVFLGMTFGVAQAFLNKGARRGADIAVAASRPYYSAKEKSQCNTLKNKVVQLVSSARKR
ncbi:hypothetical protein [Pseudomonas sp. 6D_7.1_Bac1]|uniref:hypothetical protein n=1 Tax=Pseudomonas sp. 6D_7.1_Bac1 TaxID=2971615 RepID=UPI0021C94CA0|nr:hypothetical protein [Pseudomonas sp. 6D_7.1_Bac1]MCU1750130.1 hypothetical protein [Pseudomonas sp. 6D_7.1_Bac1]